LVKPFAVGLDEEAPDADAEEGTPISEEASGKQISLSVFPGLSRTLNKPRSFWAQGTQNDSRTDIKFTTSDSPTLREALSTPIEQELWQQSIAEEMESLQAKWACVDVDVATCSPLPTHPVLQIKRTVNGEFERCETRIVAGGDHQEYGVDYTDNYASVIEWTIVRLFLYLSCVFSWEKVQVDVKTAFLNGELDEEVHVRTPRGIVGWPSILKLLLKAMYVLKQANKAWHTKNF
jgi:Reverse transcriptase (RNA-dependent DNA polymerase)